MDDLELFSDVIGHRAVKSMLHDELARPSHAYLFTGPASAGKATIARRFAAGLISDEPATIQRVLGGSHPDVMICGARRQVGHHRRSDAPGRRSSHPVAFGGRPQGLSFRGGRDHE